MEENEVVGPLRPQHKLALRLLAAGMTREEVAQATRLSLSRIGQLVHSERGRRYLQEVEAELEEQFRYLYRGVIEALREGLQHSDPTVRLAAASLWLRAQKNKVRVEFSAEDVVQQLLRQGGLQEQGQEQEQVEVGVEIETGL